MNINEKLLTIIIPVYNVEDFLDRCINSILSQEYKHLQIVLVDDGSTDKSAGICDYYAQMDDRILVIHTANKGSVAARKRGLLEAKGDYIGFVDSDDYIDKDMYSSLVRVMNETRSDFVHSGYKEVCGERVIKKNKLPYRCFEFNSQNDRIDFLKDYFLDIKKEQTISYSVCTKIFKKELIEKCFMELDDEQQIGEDALNLCRCILESKKITIIPECYYNYITREESMSHTDDGLRVINHIMLCEKIIKIIREYDCDVLLKKEITDFCISTILPFIRSSVQEKEYIRQFFLEDVSLFKGKRIVLYGGGKAGKDIYAQLERENDIEMVCWADKKYTNKVGKTGVLCIDPASIMSYKFDMVYIAISDVGVADSIRKELVKYGVEENKVLWIKPNRFF